MRRESETRVLPASIHIGRSSTYDPSGQAKVVNIRIEDRNSSLVMLEIPMTLAEFGDLLSANGYVHVDAEWSPRALDRLGMVHEAKRETISPVGWRDAFEADYLAAAKEFEVDGWKVDTPGTYNSHMRRGQDGYEAIFRRYVEPDGVDD